MKKIEDDAASRLKEYDAMMVNINHIIACFNSS